MCVVRGETYGDHHICMHAHTTYNTHDFNMVAQPYIQHNMVKLNINKDIVQHTSTQPHKSHRHCKHTCLTMGICSNCTQHADPTQNVICNTMRMWQSWQSYELVHNTPYESHNTAWRPHNLLNTNARMSCNVSVHMMCIQHQNTSQARHNCDITHPMCADNWSCNRHKHTPNNNCT